MRYLLFPLLFLNSLLANGFVTYEFSGGRFGDCLLTYLHAKWLSYKYELPLLYKPFPYSSDLCLDDREMRYNPFYPELKLTTRQPFPDKSRRVFVCPYFPEDPSDKRLHPTNYRFEADWKDPEFRKQVRSMIAPKHPLQLTTPPLSTINIAIHIREGGGYDTDHTRLWDPLKLPPLRFYIEGLQKILQHFKDRPIYCYLFTDALDPASLAAEFEKALPNLPIQFDYRRENNHHSSNVLEDFFSLLNFDVLIHPQSNYSVVASFIQDYAIAYSPTHFLRQGTKITITESALEKNEELYQKALNRTSSP